MLHIRGPSRLLNTKNKNRFQFEKVGVLAVIMIFGIIMIFKMPRHSASYIIESKMKDYRSTTRGLAFSTARPVYPHTLYTWSGQKKYENSCMARHHDIQIFKVWMAFVQ